MDGSLVLSTPATVDAPAVSVALRESALTPRDYQVAAIEAARQLIREHPRLLLVLPTGGGKTVIAALVIRGAVAKGRRVLFLAHRREIVAQSFWKLVDAGVPEEAIGVMMADGVIPDREGKPYNAKRPLAPVQVASVQTLARRAKPKADVVFVDECFPAGTLVDGRPIETLRVGDLVTAFDHATGALTRRPITRLFRSRPAGALVTLHLSDGTRLTCTDGHPIYTRRGYVHAALLTPDDEVLRVSEDLRRVRHDLHAALVEQHDGASLLARVQGEALGRTAPRGGDILQALSLYGGPTGQETSGDALLLDGVPRCAGAGERLTDDGSHQQDLREREDEGEQPDARRSAREDGRDVAAHRSPSQGARRERTTCTGASTETRGGAGVADGGRGPDGHPARERVADALQARCRLAGAHGRDRGGRVQSRGSESPRAGREEGCVPAWVRVDRVEVHERASDGGPGGLCPDGHVYNLEVADLHNYVAGGVLVHNCHHAIATSYTTLTDRYTAEGARVVGLTATPCRADGRGLKGQFDHLHVIAPPSQLIAAGYLSEPEVWAVKAPDLSGVEVVAGDYNQEQLGAAMDTVALCGNIVAEYQRLGGDRTGVVFAVNTAHSKHIAERFVAAGIPAEHLDGTMDSTTRDGILRRLASGETRVCVNCAVLTEGWDLPRAKYLALARPTKSLSLYIQMSGRVLRPWQGVVPVIVDHGGCTEEHGLPHEDREWELDAKKGKDPGKKKARRCPNEECGRVVPQGVRVCPSCGYCWPELAVPQELAGAAVKVSAAARVTSKVLAEDEARATEIRRTINREVWHLAQRTANVTGVPVEDEATSINREIVRRWRRRRPEMTLPQLEAVLAWVREQRAPERPAAAPVQPATVVQDVAPPVAPLAPVRCEPVAEEERVSWEL